LRKAIFVIIINNKDYKVPKGMKKVNINKTI